MQDVAQLSQFDDELYKVVPTLQEEKTVAQFVADVLANILTHEVGQFVSVLKR